MLAVDSLSVTYGGATALEDVTLEVAEGARVALLGANGAGKTTTLRAIGGLLRMHGGVLRAGRIRLGGEDVAGRRAHRLVAGGVGQALEGRRVFKDLTVEENLRIGGFTLRARGDRQRTLEQVHELFPVLAERRGQLAGLLSGGEQQMLAIGRALMSRPRLLLLDEPSLGLAPRITQSIADALVRISEQQGIALLLVDQSTALALRATTYAYLIEHGRTTFSGATPELLADDRVRASYLGDSEGLTHDEVLQLEEVQSA